MKRSFWEEAEKHNVLPIQGSFTDRGQRIALTPGLFVDAPPCFQKIISDSRSPP